MVRPAVDWLPGTILTVDKDRVIDEDASLSALQLSKDEGEMLRFLQHRHFSYMSTDALERTTVCFSQVQCAYISRRCARGERLA